MAKRIPIGTPCVIVLTGFPHLMGAYCYVVSYNTPPGCHGRADHMFYVPADDSHPYWPGLAINVRVIEPPPQETPAPPARIKEMA